MEPSNERRSRLYKTLIKYAVILSIGLIYLLITLSIGYGIPCPIYKLTGFKCPGCGLTRMAMAMVRLDFKSAFGYNPFLFVVGPFLIAYLVYREAIYVMRGEPPSRAWNVPLTALLIAAILFGVLRNVFDM